MDTINNLFYLHVADDRSILVIDLYIESAARRRVLPDDKIDIYQSEKMK